MDLAMKQRDVAKLLGCTEQSIRFWELNKTQPIPKYMPGLIQFLGYVPFPQPKTLSERLRRYRLIHGLTQRELAKQLKVSQDSIIGWESGSHIPTGRSVEALRRLGMR